MNKSSLNRRLLEARDLFVEEIKRKLPEALNSLGILKARGYDPQVGHALYMFAHTLKGTGQTLDRKSVV